MLIHTIPVVERECFGKRFHVSIVGVVVCISAELDDFAHGCEPFNGTGSLWQELTLAGCIDSAETHNGCSVFPCRNEVAALHLARYFADLIDCVYSFCA